jgi:hypothetical protein
VTLTATPALFARPAPATSAVIAGLAADGIPKVALNAYRVAAARINASLPGCGIDWSLVAAIGAPVLPVPTATCVLPQPLCPPAK